MRPNPQFNAELVTFTEEIVNEKLHFVCSVCLHADVSLKIRISKRYRTTNQTIRVSKRYRTTNQTCFERLRLVITQIFILVTITTDLFTIKKQIQKDWYFEHLLWN